jgi:hypothetical protein
MGRPRKNVDPKRVIELAAKGHTLDEIAAFEDSFRKDTSIVVDSIAEQC